MPQSQQCFQISSFLAQDVESSSLFLAFQLCQWAFQLFFQLFQQLEPKLKLEVLEFDKLFIVFLTEFSSILNKTQSQLCY